MTGDSMRTALLSLFAGLYLIGCATGGVTPSGARAVASPVDEAAVRQALLKADSDFSALSAQQGFSAAVAVYFADDATALLANENPLIGKAAIMANLAATPSPGFLSWEPRRAEAASSGDLGFTWGEYKLQFRSEGGQPQMRNGKYVSIWKRQADGSWKVIIDTGNASPAQSPPR